LFSMKKPRVLIDIRPKYDAYLERKPVLNLQKASILRIPLRSVSRIVLPIFVSLSFVFGFVVAPTGIVKTDVSAALQGDTERKILEAQLKELEKEIGDHEATIAEYKAQGKTLQSEINRLETQVAKLSLQIKNVTLNLTKLNGDIADTQTQISGTESQIGSNKQTIASILQTVYENDKTGLVQVLLAHPNLSDFFGDVQNLVSVQENLRDVLQKAVVLREDLLDQKEQLALEKSDAESLRAYEDAQRAAIQQTQQTKSSLLKQTKGKESEYQKIVQEKKKTAAQIRQQIFQLLGGGQLQFGDAYGLAKMASDATGVRPALILAILDRESALGQNVGRCDYKTAMHPKRDIPAFMEIVRSLGLESNLTQGVLKVSCPNKDGAYGGAMGPAQFIPSTWVLYRDRIAQITGNNPPSPWNNTDAFVATALYLKDVGADSGNINQQRIGAAKYYAGSRWSKFVWTYGDRVITQAQQFESDISILNS